MHRLFTLILLLLSSSFLNAKHHKSTEFKSIFNGKTLEGWTQKNGTATYVVKDGASIRVADIDDLPETVGLAIEAIAESQPDDALYVTTPPRRAPVTLKAIPYYLWDNRAPGEMLV